MLKLSTKSNDKINQITSISIGCNERLKLLDAHLLAHYQFPVTITQESREVVDNAYQFLQEQVEMRTPVYGVNTNFGDQVNFVEPTLNDIDDVYYQAIAHRQENIIKSLSCSLGHVVSPEIIRVTMMLRAHCLSQGYSGVKYQIIQSVVDFLNAGIVPIVHCYGSVGASGDLIPLGTIAGGLLGLNVPVKYQNKTISAQEALREAGLEKIQLTLRDGLSLINGTSFMTAIASLAVYDLSRLFNQMLTAIAISLEAMKTYKNAYEEPVHCAKKQTGQIEIAKFFIEFWKNSQLIKADKTSFDTSDRVQDYYSLRSVAQGFGPFYESLKIATHWIENEMNSVNDNPIIDVKDKKILHSANFMGYYITSACDLLKMDIAQASSWIHAILANMVHARKSQGLPTNLVLSPEVNNGFRSMQLLTAAIAVQNRKLAQSQQAYMLPTEGDNEDVNSLGTHAAFDLRESVANLERLTAILLLAGTQALELRGIEQASDNAKKVHQLIRQSSKQITQCRPMTDEINNIITLLKNELI